MTRKRNPVWKQEPYEIFIEGDDDDGWSYSVQLIGDDDDVAADEDFDGEDEALKAALRAIAKLADLNPWPKPDYEGGGVSLWWGAYNLKEGSHIVEVTSDCISEYTFVGGHEGFESDQWRKVTVCPEDAPSSDRVKASLGIQQIAEAGGEEELLSQAEVFAQWPNLTRTGRGWAGQSSANPQTLKSRLMR